MPAWIDEHLCTERDLTLSEVQNEKEQSRGGTVDAEMVALVVRVTVTARRRGILKRSVNGQSKRER